MVVYKRFIEDSVSVSSGPSGDGSSGQPTGISTRKIGGGGRGGTIAPAEQEEQKPKSNQAELRRRRIDEQIRQREEEERLRQLASTRSESKTSTGNYEKGGAVIQETRGDFNVLKELQAQQPGSRLVQTQEGEYVLIRSNKLNLAQESTFAKINENIGLEGGSQFLSTGSKNESGGTDYKTLIRDNVGVSTDFGGSLYSQQETIGTKYSVLLEDSLGGGKKGYQKTREAQPREIAEMISSGEISNRFLGSKGADIRGYEQIAASQQKFKESEVLPITYTDEEGKELVTITGKSEGAEFKVFGESKPIKLIDVNAPVPDQRSLPEIAGQTYLNVGIDIASTLPILGFGAVKNPISEGLTKYRKETPSDILFQPERYPEIPSQLSRPEFQVSAIALASTVIIPVRVPKVPRFSFQSTRSKVSQLETEFLREPGIVSGSERLSKESFLISKGTELKPAKVPLTLVKQDPKGVLKAYEITPEPKTVFPKEINIQGELFPKFQKELETKKIARYSFKSERPSREAQLSFEEGVRTEGIKPIAEVRSAPVKSILEGRSAELYEASKSTRGVYAQTRAEKFSPLKNPNIPPQPISQKGLRPFIIDLADIKPQVGAGQSARGFTVEQTDTLKDFIKAEAKQEQKQRSDFLGTINPPRYLQAQAAESQLIQYPETTPSQITGLSSKTQLKERALSIPKLSTRLEGASILEQSTKLQQRSIQKNKLKLVTKTETIPRLDTRPALVSKVGQKTIPLLKTRQIQRTKEILIPDIPLIPKEKPKPPILPVFTIPQRIKSRRNKKPDKGSRLDFFGNVPQESIVGIFGKKKEITYGGKPFTLKDLNPKKRKKSKTDRLGFPRKKGISIF